MNYSKKIKVIKVMEKTLFIIPIRSGSKGIPKKNVKLLNGKPLVFYTIDAAREVTSDEHICVSTEDDNFIELIENYGLSIPFKRPAELATDTATTEDVLNHAIDFYKKKGIIYSRIVLLQATSPLRNGKQIKEALALFSDELDMVVSVKETSTNPYYVLFEENKKGYLEKSKTGNFTRRQDCPKVWEYNGAIYVINVKSIQEKSRCEFTKIKKYEMDEFSSIDIDSQLDWKIAETILNSNS
jgi:N-acylneuraminate cytidylyltransferase